VVSGSVREVVGSLMVKVPLLVFTAVVALVLSAASFAAVKTTGPGSRVDVYVHISDKNFIVEMLTQSDYKGGEELYMTDPTEVMRGEVARFNVLNVGKKPHNFTVFGKTTPTLKPGGKATILVPLVRRGSFPYTSKSKGAKTLKGVFVVN
jgi:hypothetical protein